MKPVVGYEDYYSVTKDGRVWSHPCKWHGGKWLTLVTYKLGYIYVGLWNREHKKQKWCSVHRIVAKAYIKNTGNHKQVNHKNGIKADNRVFNLEWCSCKQNHAHAWKTGLKVFTEKHEEARKRNSLLGGLATRKLTKKQANEIKQKHKKGLLQYKIAEQYKVSRPVVCRIVNNQSYQF